MKLLLLLSCAAILADLSHVAQAADAPASSDYTVTQRGPHHRVWSRTAAEPDPGGKTVTRVHSYTELATGMHYLENGQWLEADNQIESFPGGAVARHGQTKVIFAHNLAQPGAIDMQTPDGKRLRSHLLGLSYFDSSSGSNVFFAVIKDSQGVISAAQAGEVVYADAFDGMAASVRYCYTSAGLEQDIVLQETPPAPEAFGLNEATTRIEAWTELIDPPTPLITSGRIVVDGSEIPDCDLDFGSTKISRGKAFLLGSSTNSPLCAPVAKRWLNIENRSFLVEEVPVRALSDALQTLPGGHASLSPPTNPRIRVASTIRNLPKVRTASVTSGRPMRVASSSHPLHGLVLDWISLTSVTNFDFTAGTFYISGPVYLSGNVSFSGNCVIKLAPTNSPILNVLPGSTILSRTAPYQMAVVTARGDSSIGEDIPGAGTLQRVSGTGFTAVYQNLNLKYFRFAHLSQGLAGNLDVTASHCQFVDCGTAVLYGTTLSLQNVLFANCGTNISGANGPGCATSVSAQNVTADNCSIFFRLPGNYQWPATLDLVNSLLTAVPVLTSGPAITISTNSSVLFASASGLYQQVGGGCYYLCDGSTNRNEGVTNISPTLLADLKTMTTYPPVLYSTTTLNSDTYFSRVTSRDSDAPDRGYHYQALDELAGSVSIGPGKTLTIEQGAAVGLFGSGNGTYGLSLLADSRLLSQGGPGPAGLNRLVEYSLVQEQVGLNFSKPSSALVIEIYPAAALTCRFTEFSAAAQLCPHLNLASVVGSLRDCELHGGALQVYSTLNLTNCLVREVDAYLEPWDDYIPGLRNNLFLGGTFYFSPQNITTAVVKDNLFDHTTIPVDLTGWGYDGGYNAFVSGCNRLLPTFSSDIVLSSSPAYRAGPLGPWYLPPDSPLINAGSQTDAALAGMYHFTTQTNQVKEGNTRLDLSYHYAAADATGKPMDTDSDLLADVIEDANGSGTREAGETDLASADSDGDGLTDGEEAKIWIDADNHALGHLDPLNADTGNTGIRDCDKDGDHDALSNVSELRAYHSDPGNRFTFSTLPDGMYFHTIEPQIQGGPPASLTLGKATQVTISGGYVQFTITSATPGSQYDLYWSGSAVADRWRWRRVYSGIVCDANGTATFRVPQLNPTQEFYQLLEAEDQDGDGLTDGYESYFSYGSPTLLTGIHNPDSDGDTLSDGWEVQYGLNPKSPTGSGDAAGNPDSDQYPLPTIHDLLNAEEQAKYKQPPTGIAAASFDPFKPYDPSNNTCPTCRPVVTITASTATTLSDVGAFTITRQVGNGGLLSSCLDVYYSVGGSLVYENSDYSLDPQPPRPGDQNLCAGAPPYTDGYPRIFIATIPANQPSVTIWVKLGQNTVIQGSKTVTAAITPYGVGATPQVGPDQSTWAYMVDWQKNRATLTFGENPLEVPLVGSSYMRIISPTVLELVRIMPNGDSAWNLGGTPPNTSQFQVTVNGNSANVLQVGFKRRPLYESFPNTSDLRIENTLYLVLATGLSANDAVEVNKAGTWTPLPLDWPANLRFFARNRSLRFSPAIHVNQEGYPAQINLGGTFAAAPQRAVLGYYCGNLPAPALPASTDSGAYAVDGNSPQPFGGTGNGYGPVNLATGFGVLFASTGFGANPQLLNSLPGNPANFWVGTKFTVSAAASVTHLARWVVSGNSRTHTLKLVDASTQADVPNGSVTVSGAGAAPGRYLWGRLAAPILLPAGAYYLLSSEVNGGDYWYDYSCQLYSNGAGQLDFSGIQTSSVTLVDAVTGTPLPNFSPTVTFANDSAGDRSAQYQGHLLVDFNGFSQAGEYRLKVDGLGASFPFRIGDDVLLKLARTYALGLYHQRCGHGPSGQQVNTLPFTRFLHGDCHTSPASIPVPQGSYVEAWGPSGGISDPHYGGTQNPNQKAPALNSESAMIFPFRQTGSVDVSGGHHDAGDYSKYTINSAAFIHSLLFAADNFRGTEAPGTTPYIATLDNLGIPESGDANHKSDLLQEAKIEADFLVKMQDIGLVPGLNVPSGGFYTLVYPRDEQYEAIYPPDHGDPQIVWPKTTCVTAAAVGALAEIGSSPTFCTQFGFARPAPGDPPDWININNPYLKAAKWGWDFLMRARDATYQWQTAGTGKDNSYQKCYYYGDEFTHNDELAWAAAAMFAAGYSDTSNNGIHDPHTLLRQWYPRPDDPSVPIPFAYPCSGDSSPCSKLHQGWWGLFQGYGCAARDYAFAVLSGRRSSGAMDATYLGYCQTAIKDWGHKVRSYAEANAYQTALPQEYAWHPEFFFPGYWAFDIAVTDQLDTTSDDHSRNTAAVLGSFNFELGCNPNNVGFLPGLGWRRQRTVVNQYWYNAGRVLPPTGNPIAGINDFQLAADSGLRSIFYPAAADSTAGFALYDRWADAATSESEFVGVQTARSLAAAAWLAAQSSPNRNQSWSAAQITAAQGSFSPSFDRLPTNTRQTVQLTSSASPLPLSEARIVWDRAGQQPVSGNSFTFTTGSTPGNDRIDAEAVFKDGRRVFATLTFPVYDRINGGTQFPVNASTAALYYFDNSLADQTTARHDFTLAGSPTYIPNPAWMSGPSGAAISFYRLSDQLSATIPGSAFYSGTTLLPITIEFRIYPRAFLAPNYPPPAINLAYVVYLYQSDQAYLVFEYPFNGGTAVGFSSSGNVPVPLSLNTWHNIKITIAPNGNVSVVVDGGSPITATSTQHAPNSTTPWTLRVGQFQGDLDYLRISNQL